MTLIIYEVVVAVAEAVAFLPARLVLAVVVAAGVVVAAAKR